MSDSSEHDTFGTDVDDRFEKLMKDFMPDETKKNELSQVGKSVRDFLLLIGAICIAVLMIALTVKGVMEIF